MIIEFSTANFRSIKEMQTLKLNAANIVSKYKEIDKQNIVPVTKKLSLLKSKAIYGANASGKSNLIKALLSFIAIVNKSVKDDKVLEDRIEPFLLSEETEQKPSFFQLLFIVDSVQYRYGFEATDSKITSEWLFGSPNKREVPYFTREDKTINVNEKQFKEGIKFTNLYLQNGNDIARENSLFLTAVKALNGDISKLLVDYISSIIIVSGLADRVMHAIAADSLGDDIVKKKIIELLKIADIGIENLGTIELSKENLPAGAPQEFLERLEKGKKHFIIVSEHKKYNSKKKKVKPAIFTFTRSESEGSKKMFEISPFIIQALEEKRPLFIDEFDARFHPVLTKKLVELFNSEANQGTQIVFTTHDTNLLNAKLLRRDQVSFIEKDKFGGTHLYDLINFKGVRNDSSFEKDYISGKYGAIPFLGDFNKVF